jgi:hypothetical protein
MALKKVRQMTHLAHLLVALNERVHNLDCQEIIINGGLSVGEENVGGYDGGQVMRVHFRSRFLVNLVERCNPVEE